MKLCKHLCSSPETPDWKTSCHIVCVYLCIIAVLMFPLPLGFHVCNIAWDRANVHTFQHLNFSCTWSHPNLFVVLDTCVCVCVPVCLPKSNSGNEFQLFMTWRQSIGHNEHYTINIRITCPHHFLLTCIQTTITSHHRIIARWKNALNHKVNARLVCHINKTSEKPVV